jgi:hypothetical protein
MLWMRQTRWPPELSLTDRARKVATAAMFALCAVVAVFQAALAQADGPGGPSRLVVFEEFLRPTCPNCQAASVVVDQLMTNFAGQPVVFLEQNIDASIGNRMGRWVASYPGNWTQTYLPWVMADSGHGLSTGAVNYATVYTSMIDTELARPPQAAVEAFLRRIGNTFRVYVRIVNQSQATLSASANDAAVDAIVWETGSVGLTGHLVRAVSTVPISAPLAPGGTFTATLNSATLSGVDWDNLHALALVDYRPGGTSGAYDMLQAAIATAPGITATPEELSFEVNSGTPSLDTAELALAGPTVVSWTSSSDVLWLDVEPPSGTLPAQVSLTVRPGLLPWGVQQGHLTFTGTSADGLALTTTVSVQAQHTDQPRRVRIRLRHAN